MRRKAVSSPSRPSRQAARRKSSGPGQDTPHIGRLVGLGQDTEVEVRVEGSGRAHLARSMVPVTSDDLGREVLLTGGLEERPVVVGFVLSAEELARGRNALPGQVEARLDGERVVLSADREIELRCGKSSLILRADGKVVLRGENVVSSASGPNRIRGGSVQIN